MMFDLPGFSVALHTKRSVAVGAIEEKQVMKQQTCCFDQIAFTQVGRFPR
ncbi:MAG: hypothetical protein ABI411_07410 [Tahibacter sp.]